MAIRFFSIYDLRRFAHQLGRRPVAVDLDAIGPVDPAAHERARAIREAEYQAALDADSRVLRVSGQTRRAGRAVSALVERRSRRAT